MPVKFENLVELFERSCREFAGQRAVRDEAGERLDVDHLRRVRRAGERVPRRPREPRRRARRRGRDHRRQPRRVGRRVLRHLRPRRGLRPDVRGAARQGVGVHPGGLRGEGRHRRHRRRRHRRCAACSRSSRRSQHVIGLELPASDDHSYAALLAVGRQRPVPAVFAVVRRRRRPHLHLRHHRQPEGRHPHPRQHHLERERDARRCSRSPADDRSLSFLPWAHSFGQTCELHCLLSMGARWRSATTSRTWSRTWPR